MRQGGSTGKGLATKAQVVFKGAARRAWHEVSMAATNVRAIASMTFKDAIRKKVLFTLVFFALLLVGTVFLSWVRVEYRLQQMTRILLGGMGFFGMIAAVFLAAPNLPDDIKNKTIFTVLTKPARRWHVLAGKILGIGYVLAVLLFLMGAMSYAYLSFWGRRMQTEGDTLPVLQGHHRTYAASVEHLGMSLDITEAMIESERAFASGFERMTFHFDRLDSERFSNDVAFAEVILFSHGASYDPRTKEGTGLMQVQNPTTGEIHTEVFGAETLRPTHVSFPASMIDDSGRLTITLNTRLKSGNYSAMAGSVAVLSQPSTYGINFLKALTLMFMQYMVLVFVATAASTFLTSTVSTITALFVYFTGSLTEMLRAQALELGTRADLFAAGDHSHDASEAVAQVAHVAVNFLMRYFYIGVSIAFPNLSSFSPAGAMSASEYISPATLGNAFLYALVFSTASFVIAWAIFSRKEVA